MADYKVLACTENITHQEWLAYRNLGIGGSDASVVCGVNKWKSPIELYMEKLEMMPPSEAGEAAYWGNRLEGLVKEEFTLRTGLEVHPVKQILQSAEHLFMLANLDGVVYHPDYGECVFEAKTSSAYRAGEWSGGNGGSGIGTDSTANDSTNGEGHENGEGIPPEYLIQIQHYMAVTGFKGAYIAVLVGGNSFKYQFVRRDDELISMLIQLEGEFWDRVVSGNPPELDGSDASQKFLNRLYPESVPDTSVRLPESALSLIQQHSIASSEIKRLTEVKQEAENLLKQMLGDSEVGVLNNGGGVVNWKSSVQERLDTKAIKADHPTLCNRYTNTTTSRRFSIKSA